MQAMQKICQWCICYDWPLKVDEKEKEIFKQNQWLKR